MGRRPHRVEEVTGDAWTKVLRTKRGRTIRADYTRVEWRPPTRITWRQEVEESPFEAILDESTTTISLEAIGDEETRVEIAAEQELHGRYRTGGFMLRRATRKQLDQALDGLEQAVAG